MRFIFGLFVCVFVSLIREESLNLVVLFMLEFVCKVYLNVKY